jgi:imidazolonepropionase-like amidohydrolase
MSRTSLVPLQRVRIGIHYAIGSFASRSSPASTAPAITVGTKNGARLLGTADEVGTLTPGHEASFIALDKDPSADIRNTETILATWKAGKQVSAGPLAAAQPQGD